MPRSTCKQMKWNNHKFIFNVSGNGNWMNSHAQCPVAIELDGYIRVFFSSRVRRNLALPTYVDLDSDSLKVLKVHTKPILDCGEAGSFDNHGIFPVFIWKEVDAIYLYYVGWYRGSDINYHNAVGIAASYDNGDSFVKLFPGPIMPPLKNEPYACRSLWIEKIVDQYVMVYASDYGMYKTEKTNEPVYDLKVAMSKDLINWVRNGVSVVKHGYFGEAIARPTILKDNSYHMWFSYRGSKDFGRGKDAYKIGYAKSDDMKTWVRTDESSGFSPSNQEWDQEMQTYPYIIKLYDKTLMFYNGNDFGATGFGCVESSNNF